MVAAPERVVSAGSELRNRPEFNRSVFCYLKVEKEEGKKARSPSNISFFFFNVQEEKI